MNEPYFSIIVPVYNVEKYLPQCVDSILRQTYGSFEVILVDDGTKDRSGELCDQYSAQDDRIKVIHKKNGGLSSARNAGIREAGGKYIIFMDSDDYWSNNTMLEQISSSIGEREELVVWKYYRCDENGSYCNDGEKAAIKEYSLSDDYRMLFGKGVLFASAWYEAIPRTWFLSHDLFFEEGVVSEDIEWFGRLLACVENIVSFEAVFYVYRIRQGSISKTVTPKTVLNLEQHLRKLMLQHQATPQGCSACYLGEQAANFAIVLSRCGNVAIDVDRYRQFFAFAAKAVRIRSRVFYYFYKFLGMKRAISLLKKVG